MRIKGEIIGLHIKNKEVTVRLETENLEKLFSIPPRRAVLEVE